METLDSDVENECFESAEESLDENEEKNENSKSNKNLRNSESETTGPICDTADSVCQIKEDNSNNSLSYRKRPEKLKRLSGKMAVKPTSKSSQSEIILKTDKIVPDVFFQDITSNLSKNINKSLNTIQQKSSNVKDLILSSLPVSSSIKNEGFSYDDKNNSVVLDNETEPGSTKPESEEIDLSEESLKLNSEDDIKNEKKTSESYQSDSERNILIIDKLNASINEKSESSEITNFTLKKEDCSYENIIASDILKSKATISEKKENLKESDSECSDHLYYIAENSHTLEIHIPKINENLKGSAETFHNSKNVEIFSDQQEVINEGISNTEADNTYLENTLGVCIDKENLGLKNNGNDTGLVKNEENNPLLLDKNEVNSEFIFNELKNALENIVKEEITCAESGNKSSSNSNARQVCCLEEKIEINKSTIEGWDDFDFSDSEIECVRVSHPDNSEEKNTSIKLMQKQSEETSNSMDPVLIQDNKKKNLSVTKKFLRKVNNSVVKNKNVITQERSKAKEENDKGKEIKEFVENKPELDDTWDWDNWNETQSDDNVAEMSSTENFDVKDIRKCDFDVSKWSGWDTFAQKPQEKHGGWSFGSWGVDVLLNKATAVTQGISSVLEAGLGAPDPETLARMEIEKKKPQKKVEIENEECFTEISKKNSLTNVNIFPVSGITNLVAGMTSKIVEHSKIQEIGSKVITGGLDTLETFGKKTMEVLQEGDPGLKSKRALLLGNNKPVLSQVLKEAREKANSEMKKAEEKEWARKCHFETLFDDFQGLVHLEALEMVSRQCELKLDQIRSEKNSEEQEHLNELLEEIQQLCSLDECDIDVKFSVLDFKTALQMAVKPIKNEISIENLIKIHENVSSWLQMSLEKKPSFTVIYQKLVSTLAELTAVTVHQFHKGGELLSVEQCRMTLEEVDGLSSLTNILCKEINQLCEKFFLLSCNETLSEIDNPDSVKEKITAVMKNSTSYIKQAFDLLIPVIQLGAVSF